MMVDVDLCGEYDGRYSLLPTPSHRSLGSMKIAKRGVERGEGASMDFDRYGVAVYI